MIDYITHPWTEEELRQLPALWATGTTTVEIGRQLGKTKGSVIGKVARMGLPHRPSPIRPVSQLTKEERRRNSYYKKNNRTPPPERPGLVSLPALVSVAPRKSAPIELSPLFSNSPCRWPIGDPGNKDFKFCCEPTELGRPYCPRHCKVAYIPIRDRREDRIA
jgi:GcrA cell cycle regulator